MHNYNDAHLIRFARTVLFALEGLERPDRAAALRSRWARPAGRMASARDWLVLALADGPVLVSKLQAAALIEGHYWSTVRQVKVGLGVVTTRLGGKGSGGASQWRIPLTTDVM